MEPTHQVRIYSNSSKTPFLGLYEGVYEFQVDHLRDPQGRKDFRHLTGKDPIVRAFVTADPRVGAILAEVQRIVYDHVKTKAAKAPLVIAFRDFHGRWKATAVAEIVSDYLKELKYSVLTIHNALTTTPTH